MHAAPPPDSRLNTSIPQELSLEKKDGRALTLDESIKIAVRGASDVLKAENNLRFDGARLLQAYGQFLPNIQASGAYGPTTGNYYSTVATPVSVTGSSLNAGYLLTADLNIFNGLADFSNLKSTILKKNASDLTLQRAKQAISLDVARSFLQVILDNKITDIAKKEPTSFSRTRTTPPGANRGREVRFI